MRILVTGGLGYIGSHTCVELMEMDHEVIIVDNLSNSKESVLKGIERITNKIPKFYKVDINNLDRMKVIMKENLPDSVIHFAAYKSVPESENHPIPYYRNNLGGLINLLFSMEGIVKSFIYSSSCSVYGEPSKFPVKEDSPTVYAESVYGDTKIKGEEILRRLKHLNTVSLRYFNPMGAHESLEIGENPLGTPENLLPKMIQYSLEGKKFIINGNDWETPDGTCIRDFIHVVDLAKAHVKALDFILKKTEPDFIPLNIGTGKGTSVKEIVDVFNRVSEKKLEYSFGERRNGDIGKIWGDCKKAEMLLGFKTKFGIVDMVESAWAWENKKRD